VAQPVTQDYNTKQIVLVVSIILIFAGLIFGAVVLIKKYAKKAKDWLTPDF
jgi:hypothetical protein